MRKAALAITVATTLALAGAAAAQTTGSTSSNQPSATPNQSSGSSGANATHRQVMTIGQLRQELQQAGFTDVKVIEDAFVVQAKTKDGHPIMLTIGPNGFSAVEGLNSPGTSPQPSGQSGTGSATQTPSTGQTGSK